MSKIKSLLTINKSKDTLKGIKTIQDLKIALEQDIMRSENTVIKKIKRNVNKFTEYSDKCLGKCLGKCLDLWFCWAKTETQLMIASVGLAFMLTGIFFIFFSILCF